MIPNSAKLFGILGSTSHPEILANSVKGVLSTSLVRNNSQACLQSVKSLFDSNKSSLSVPNNVGQVRNESSCGGQTLCESTKGTCSSLSQQKFTQAFMKKKPGGITLPPQKCGYIKPEQKPCDDLPCIEKCCPVSCRIKDPCCTHKCNAIPCPPVKELKCCNKRPCCPNDDFGKNQCCKEPPTPRIHRCDQEGACNDPCCSRVPCCKKEEKLATCDEFDVGGDPLERPCPTHPCDVKGAACDLMGAEENDCCADKMKRDACDEGPCPRRTKCERKKPKSSNQICLNLDSNWPPKRSCGKKPQKDPCTPCQRDCKPHKHKFDDGLC
ncbi:keratin-associated protein 5-3-like [Cimex lectularius]|uniref:Uncharacterized protein n=1 Tax=Cimex lectularius TaxID=79782 RepID=A0A8I6TLG5_CIMLE|nr:keratin-associated protein 5-3-like [Cimex lectularius]